MRVNHILVDYENVQPDDFEILNHEAFRVLVFIGAKQEKLPSAMVRFLDSMEGRGKYVWVKETGRDVLDSHVHYYLGRLTVAEPEGCYHVISKDTGFDALIRHLVEVGVQIARRESLDGIPALRILRARNATERAQLFREKLEMPKATRPATVARLSHHIAAHFGKMLEQEEIAAVIKALAATGFLAIEDKKILYTAPSIPRLVLRALPG